MPVTPNRFFECGEVARVIVEVPHEAHFRLIAGLQQPAGGFINDGCCRTGRVLRVHRDHQYPAGPFGSQVTQNLADGRLAIAHRRGDGDMVAAFAQQALEQLGLALGMHAQRRAFGHPDAGVLGCGFLRAGVEDDAVKDQPPQRLRNFDHAGVGQKFAEVAAQGGRRGGVRGAQVDEDDSGAGRQSMAVRRLGEETGHQDSFLKERALLSRRAVMSTIGMTRS